jgi:hypothetical protein
VHVTRAEEVLTDIVARHGQLVPLASLDRAAARQAVADDRCFGATQDRVMGGGTVFVVRLSRAGRGPQSGYVLPEPITMADIGDALADNPWESLGEMDSWLTDHGLVQRGHR